MKRAQEYNDYWNIQRVHSGKGMNNMTPKEKLLQQGFHQVNRILDFQVLYLDQHFHILQRHLECFLLQIRIQNTSIHQILENRKTSIDLLSQYTHLALYAQNVLTYYLSLRKRF
jgi:hypothetical protein